MPDVRVLVVGAGVGGLCLAQGLRRAGIAVAVFEREPAILGPGHRSRIDQQGINALTACLPPELVDLFHATCNPVRPPRRGIFDHQLVSLVPESDSTNPVDLRRASAVTNDRTLRELLGSGLNDAVAFGREAVGVRDEGDRVVVELADGGTESGDVLVAADGIDSMIRHQLLPGAELVDTGLIGVSGAAPLTPRLLGLLPEALYGGSAPIIAPDGLTLAVGVYQPRTRPDLAAASIAPRAQLSAVADHVKWTLVGPPEVLGVTGAEQPEHLHRAAAAVTGGWSPVVADLIAGSPPAATFAVRLRAALPVPPWPSARVTLLGDAIHATAAVGGAGASVALRDAALLTQRLADAAAQRMELGAALASYEEAMRDYGFAAALQSLQAAEQLFRVYIPALG